MKREARQVGTGATRFPAYPAYKDSGVEWLGPIPAHWEVRPLKYCCGMNSETLNEETSPDYELRYVDISNVDSTGNVLGTEELRFENAPSRARRKVRSGDTIISTVRTYLKAIAYLNDPPDNLIVSTGFAVLRPHPELYPPFLWRVVQSEQFVQAVQAYSEGVGYPAINPVQLGRLAVWIPKLDEQHSIAAFLDRETAKIDALVAKKERLIVLLQEKRAALITHAVTKGLDPTVPMKGSGIEWLGKIPAHWEVKRLKHVAKEPLQYGASEASEFNDPGEPRFIRITDIDETGQLREDTFRSLPEEIARPYLLKRGDLLLARSGATVGKTFLYQESWGKACYAGYLIRLRTNNAVCTPEFVSYFTLSSAYWSWLSGTFIQATIQNVSAERYANLRVTLPPLREQQQITSFLDRETAKLDALIAKVREGIEKLKEYRTALISAVVTGKIDVWEALPESCQSGSMPQQANATT